MIYYVLLGLFLIALYGVVYNHKLKKEAEMEGTHTHVISQEFFICVNADGTATYKTGNNETALFQNFGNAFEIGKKDAKHGTQDIKESERYILNGWDPQYP